MTGEPFPATVTVAGIKIRNLGEIKTMGTAGLALRVGDRVMVEQYGDVTYGVVHIASHAMPFIPPMRMMRSILRKATDAEAAAIEQHERIAREGMAYCRERAAAHGLRMKLVEVYCSFRRRETTFVYTAEERVDFRQLVRDLARRFGGRIEMRHIGLRDEARRLSGVDTCGRVLCCAAFLTDMKPISIRQARNQGLQLNDSSLIGVCGLLKCCLMFECQTDTGGTSAVQPLIQPTRLVPLEPDSDPQCVPPLYGNESRHGAQHRHEHRNDDPSEIQAQPFFQGAADDRVMLSDGEGNTCSGDTANLQ